jgi:hypothetical protein
MKALIIGLAKILCQLICSLQVFRSLNSFLIIYSQYYPLDLPVSFHYFLMIIVLVQGSYHYDYFVMALIGIILIKVLIYSIFC